MAGFEELGREYLKDLLGEPVPRGMWPDGVRAQLEEFEEAAGLHDLPRPLAGLFDDDPDPIGRCVLRRSCGRSCYCAKAGAVYARRAAPVDIVIQYAPEVVAELRRRFGPHWPAESPMLEHRPAPDLQVHEYLRRTVPDPEAVRQLLENTGRTAAEMLRNWRT